MRLISVLTVAACMMVGCTTQEYEIEKTHCTAQWYDVIKPNLVQRVETQYREEKRYSGRKTCEPDGTGGQRCKPLYYKVDIPYQVQKTVDINKPERDARIKACTINACQQKFGNASCDISPPN